ncbi:MAG: OB-fold nucleic acid binding domain-containing protein [Nanoarchaeota archaeon]|nr:OB-fold nucleic acid binding domain-containing protein [Nanoarchaeota archaeon]
MNEQLTNQPMKRNVAYKLRIGNVLGGKVILDGERFKHLEIDDKKVVRVNIIANVVDKFLQEGEKKYASLTLDDATGQLRVKLFGEDVEKINKLNQGDTVLVIGLLRIWNNELYVTPEIMKNKEPSYLLVRKLEIESEQPKSIGKEAVAVLKDKIIAMVKEAEKDGGVDIGKMIMELHEPPEVINQEVRKLLEEGMAYEPRPGKLRYLG